jgi:translation initiation factor IF-2
MSKVRIYNLAKELRLESQKVLEDARRFGAEVGAVSSSVDAAIAEKIRELYYPKKQAAQRAPRLVKAHNTAPVEERHREAGSAVVSVSEEAARETEAKTEPQTGKIKAAAKWQAPKGAPAARVVAPVAGALALAEETAFPAATPAPKPITPTTRIIRLPTPPPRPVAKTAEPADRQPAKVLPFGKPKRTTYVPPRDTRPKGRHNARRREPAERFDKSEPQQKSSLRLAQPAPARVIPTELKPARLTEGCTVRDFAEKLGVAPKNVVAELFARGVMATINQTLNPDVAREVGKVFGYDVSFGAFEEMIVESEFEITPEAMDDTDSRAPVITMMGHVDHGKTSLLDAIRATRVAEGEAGGITQRIGAYSVEAPDPDNPSEKRRVVFLDTPGHEAFTMMRARGAKGADIVVLVVAADDGVMPQTVEAIEHARAADAPIVVAINKIDKPEANPERVKKELADHGLLWDGWGGSTTMVEVSAKKGQNIDDLLEMILLTADILELKANPKRMATGAVLEAKLDRGRGAVATVLIGNGTLRVGDPFIAGDYFGRVRAMMDDHGRRIDEAGPATPVEVIGLEGVPSAGDQFQVVSDVVKAQRISNYRRSKARASAMVQTAARGLDQLAERIKLREAKELLVILKADVQGSVEALRAMLGKLSTDKVKARVIRSGVGAITESDVLLASASNATSDNAATVIIGFNVRPEARALEIARRERVDIRLHSIIYKVEEEIRAAMLGLLAPTIREKVIGRAEVREVIRAPKVGHVAGCKVTAGSIKRAAGVRLIRDNVVIFESAIASLRRFKDDVSEVQQGYECGLAIERFSDYKVGDVIEAFVNEKVSPTLL